MSLATGQHVKRHSWTPMPMTQEVIDQAIEFGETENAPDGMIIRDLDGDVDHNGFECDEIKQWKIKWWQLHQTHQREMSFCEGLH